MTHADAVAAARELAPRPAAPDNEAGVARW